MYTTPMIVSYNTRLVSHGELPKEYFDLLSPKWKGRLGLDSSDFEWYANLRKTWGAEKAQKFLDTTESLLGVLVDRLGKNSWVVGTDYPHADTMGSWPNTVAVIPSREDLSPEAKDAILGGNALRLFGLSA
jgi:hypothetical protein